MKQRVMAVDKKILMGEGDIQRYGDYIYEPSESAVIQTEVFFRYGSRGTTNVDETIRHGRTLNAYNDLRLEVSK
jgi:hypothetical protein